MLSWSTGDATSACEQGVGWATQKIPLSARLEEFESGLGFSPTGGCVLILCIPRSHFAASLYRKG